MLVTGHVRFGGGPEEKGYARSTSPVAYPTRLFSRSMASSTPYGGLSISMGTSSISSSGAVGTEEQP
jgi:hypothetical protein